jgi:hypothetical protein
VLDLVARLAVIGFTEMTCGGEVVRRALGQQDGRVVRRGRRPLPTEKDGAFRRVPALGHDVVEAARRVTGSFDDPIRDVVDIARKGLVVA